MTFLCIVECTHSSIHVPMWKYSDSADSSSVKQETNSFIKSNRTRKNGGKRQSERPKKSSNFVCWKDKRMSLKSENQYCNFKAYWFSLWSYGNSLKKEGKK